jgi:hypothetical protein
MSVPGPVRIALCAVALALAGCATYQSYSGAKRARDEVAVVHGDAKLRAEMPVAVVIRAVDGRPVDLKFSSVALLPGKHELVVDCQVGGASGSTTRHQVDVDAGPNESYRLVAEMSPGNRSCARVVLE